MEPEEGKLIEEYRTLFKFCRINGATEEDIKKLKKITSKLIPFNPMYRKYYHDIINLRGDLPDGVFM